MPDRSYRRLFWCLALTGLAIDLATKYGIFHWLGGSGGVSGEHVVVGGVFELLAQFEGTTPRVNKGALFGLLGEHKELANGLFAAISLAAAVAILVWSSRPTAARDRGLAAALGFILGGTLGNLYDRLVFGGVRDFLHLHYYNKFDWPVFNVADCCLVAGAGLLLIQAFFAKPVPVAPPAAAAEKAEASATLSATG